MENIYNTFSKDDNLVDYHKNYDWYRNPNWKENGYKPFMVNENGNPFDCSVGKFIDISDVGNIFKARGQSHNGIQSLMPSFYEWSNENQICRDRVCKMAFNLRKYSLNYDIFPKKNGYVLRVIVDGRFKPVWQYVGPEDYYFENGQIQFTSNVLISLKEKVSKAQREVEEKRIEEKREEEEKINKEKIEENKKPIQTDLFSFNLSNFRKKSEKIPGGLSNGSNPEKYDKKQLEKGTKVEMEHTSDQEIAREIAMDHLEEDPKYYDKLEKIEKH